MKPATLLIPVPDVKAGVAWYKRAFPAARPVYLPEFDFTSLLLTQQGVRNTHNLSVLLL
ncbi:hypothetical protein [Xenorhabdus koppenhoeferi]|uniref:hypothetical protein n=1 Tax=Xenorhabdus koppenhoeferi TaxID=351659 RepID=UPI002B417EF0|nr:hypothetical protein [Xenorhabdus sp. Vera]